MCGENKKPFPFLSNESNAQIHICRDISLKKIDDNECIPPKKTEHL